MHGDISSRAPETHSLCAPRLTRTLIICTHAPRGLTALYDFALALCLTRRFRLRVRRLEAQQAIPPLEEKVATLVEEKAQQEDDYRKHAEEVKQLWEEKELECEALRNEMTRLQGLHAECLAEGSLEALRRKQIGFAPPAATALVGKARALIYEEALKQPVAQNGLAKPEAVSWRGTTHDYAQPAKDFHQSEMERPEPTYGPRQKAPFRKPPPAPKPLSAYEEAKLLHGRQPEPPRPWPHNQPKSLSPRPRHRPPPTSPVPFFIQP